MTFILNQRYPARANAPSSDYLRGSAKNRTSSTAEDGTYLEQDWINDERAFFDRLLTEAGVTPNGQVDTAPNCQTWDALVSIINSYIGSASQPFYALASGGANALTATYSNSLFQLRDGQRVLCRAAYSNSSTAPTFNPNGTGARTIMKGNNLPLQIGDISGAGHILDLVYDARYGRWNLLNPAYGINFSVEVPVGTLAFMARNTAPAGWLRVDGGEYNRAQYAELVAAVPQFIQNGSSAATFRFIDLRGHFLRVLDNGRGIDPNRGFGSTQGDAIRNIYGNLSLVGTEGVARADGAFYHAQNIYGYSIDHDQRPSLPVVGFDASRVTPTAGENRPKNIALPIFIKY